MDEKMHDLLSLDNISKQNKLLYDTEDNHKSMKTQISNNKTIRTNYKFLTTVEM
uniref:Uncharacterized protein MANES_11G019400 n=1 Tax=Rhizophora mucronata TaxID=61149 RepID=A0A2P2MWU2_RHIMU